MSHEIVTLRDSAGTTSAKIMPCRGLNCISFVVEQGGQPLEVLWTAPDFESGQARASSSGIPILFPFPGRLKGTRITFGGRDFELEAGDGLGNAIHGFVIGRPWRVLQQTRDTLLGRFLASQDAPEILQHWPADFEITVSIRVAANRLEMQTEITNPGGDPLPFGLGLHPYFRVPVGGRDAADCKITVPADKCWELHDMLPTGKIVPADDAGLPSGGLLFRDAQFDHVFTEVQFQDGVATSRIHDPQSGRTTVVTFDQGFRECVVYTPGHREAICIEPYTCVPDAYRLAEGGQDTGLRVLKSGEKFAATMAVEVE